MTKPSKKPEEEVLERVEETFKRYVGILSEDFQSKLSVVGEQVGSLGEKMYVMGDDIKEIKIDVVSIKNALGRKVEYDEFTGLERRVTSLEAKSKRT